jgi:hypothetical protein
MPSVQIQKDAARFIVGENDRQPSRPLCPLHLVEPADVALEDFSVQEQKGAQSLVLRGCGNQAVARQMGEKFCDLGFPHLFWMAFSVIQNEPADPIAVRSLRPKTKMFPPDDIPDLIEEFWLEAGRKGA